MFLEYRELKMYKISYDIAESRSTVCIFFVIFTVIAGGSRAAYNSRMQSSTSTSSRTMLGSVHQGVGMMDA